MRKSTKRAVTFVANLSTLTAVLMGSAPAARAELVAPTCAAGSTVLVDFYTLGGSHTRIATFDVSPKVKNVCVELFGVIQTVVVVRSDYALTPPSVNPTPGVGRCAQPIIDMTAPVSLSLSVGATSAPSVCLGQNGTTTTISFGAASAQAIPWVEVWTPRNTLLNTYVACGMYVGTAQHAACSASDHNLTGPIRITN